MGIFQIVAILLSLAALFAYINERLFRLPNTIGIMLIGLILSLLLLLVDGVLPGSSDEFQAMLAQIDFDETLLQGMLSFLLFAGALHVNLDDLFDHKWIVGILATIGVTLSTVVVGFATMLLVRLVGLPIDPIYCFLFGALISPTDPIAVLGILKKLGAPKSLETMITGESLFNDGVGVVIFVAILGIATSGEAVSAAHIAELFVHEAIGGLLFGLVLGYIGYLLVKSIDNYHVEVLITLAIVTGGYALAFAMHVSGPIAMVVAGLMVGNQGRRLAMSDLTRRRLDDFWELVDEIFNAVLFMLMGIEIILLSFDAKYLLAGLIAIPMVLVIRFGSVGLPMTLLRWKREFPPLATPILTWGGLRGGISVALALSLPDSPARDPIITMTYCIVIFSIMVQGLTVGRLIERSQQQIAAKS